MRSISIDFKNRIICIMTEGQQGTEFAPNVEKEVFKRFIPEKYREYNSFTWNFQNETFSVNQEYVLHEGSIMTKNCFIPQFIVPIRGLKKRYGEFIEVLGYEEIDIKKEMPEELRKLLGLD